MSGYLGKGHSFPVNTYVQQMMSVSAFAADVAAADKALAGTLVPVSGGMPGCGAVLGHGVWPFS